MPATGECVPIMIGSLGGSVTVSAFTGKDNPITEVRNIAANAKETAEILDLEDLFRVRNDGCSHIHALPFKAALSIKLFIE